MRQSVLTEVAAIADVTCSGLDRQNLSFVQQFPTTEPRCDSADRKERFSALNIRIDGFFDRPDMIPLLALLAIYAINVAHG
jgi:hypothetical protein